jgi:hypothetical protein
VKCGLVGRLVQFSVFVISRAKNAVGRFTIDNLFILIVIGE